MTNKNLIESFAHAFEGLSHVLWTQKHVRTQLFLFTLILLLSFFAKLSTLEVLIVFTSVMAVLLAEMFNTAIEVVVNMITESYHPLAKIAKDVAAAGVLIASMYAVLVGGGIFFNKTRIGVMLHGVRGLKPLEHLPSLTVVVLLGIAVVMIIVALTKIKIGHGTIFRGGAVSGHTAVAFILSAAIFIYSGYNPGVSIMALCLAVLVAQSRVEGKIHTVAEVIWGAIVALLLMALLMLISSTS
ncbi:MAG TPA: diacylglycerol kinase [Armatimonadota bacterium]